MEPPYTAYICGLPDDIDWTDLPNIFEKQKILNIRFVNESKGLRGCYVEFKTLENLNEAVSMDGVKFNGLTIKIAIAAAIAICRSPYPQKAPFVAYIGNLHDDVDYDDIHRTFEKSSIKKIIFMHDLFTQICYVEFKSLKDLMDAVRLNGVKIKGLEAIVDFGQRLDYGGDFIKEPAGLYPTTPPFTVFVGNLPKVFRGDILRIFCQQNVQNIRFIKNEDSGEFHNYCFVDFETLRDLKEAVKMNRRVYVENRTIRIDLARDSGGNRDMKLWDRLTVRIGDFPQRIKRIFNQENIRKIRFLMDGDTRRFKGSCFVEFRTFQDLEEAVGLDGVVDVEGLMIKIIVADLSAVDIKGNRIDDVKVPLPTEPPYVAHISNLPISFVQHNVTTIFKNQNVQAVRFIVDKKTKRAKGICSVKFNSTKDLKKATKMDGAISVKGRTVKMDIAENFVLCRDRISFPTEPPFTAYVAGLPDRTFTGDVIKIFSNQNVKNVRLIFDRDTSRFRNFGFVEFETLEELKEAVAMSGSFMVDGSKITIRVAKRRDGSSV